MATVLGVAKALIDSASIGEAERQVLDSVVACRDKALIESVRAAVEAEQDPLGEAYCAINSAQQRRDRGQTFTPEHVVAGMFGWVKRQRKVIARLVDPGAGSGRYTLAGLRAFPEAEAVAVEMDPALALILRANLAAAGLAERVSVVVGDFRSLQLPRISGVTLFVGNPPYVRHHHIAGEWKSWYSRTLKRFGHEGSQLAGLHLHFFLKTLELASQGDLGCYVTAAEWLDVKYGQALRRVVYLPQDLGSLGEHDKAAVDRFLEWARSLGAHETYTAQHRNPWWSVGFKEAAPIVMTYMGCRPPVFAINKVGAQLINIAHGLYPRQDFTAGQLTRLVAWLNVNVSQESGRMYAGGLTKFEPSEAMRILVPASLAG